MGFLQIEQKLSAIREPHKTFQQ